MDDFIYGEMSPHVRWKRSNTIGRGETYCDFCFVHETKTQKYESLISRIEEIMKITNRTLAYCGNDCIRCPQYRNDCFEGCLGDTCANYCRTCAVRLCNRENNTANCAQCGEYPCEKLEKQFENMANDGYSDWVVAARKVLEEILRQ